MRKDALYVTLLSLIVFFSLTATDQIFFSAAAEPVSPNQTEEQAEKPEPIISDNEQQSDQTDSPNAPTDIGSDKSPDENEIPSDDPQKTPSEEEPEYRSDQLSGAAAEIVRIAKGEKGYYPKGSKTKYAGYFDSGQVEWSAEFLAWCIASTENNLNIQLSGRLFPWTDSLSVCLLWFAVRGCLYEPDKYSPIGGDYVFFDDNGDGLTDGVGIIAYRKEVIVTEFDNKPSGSVFIDVIRGNDPQSGTVTEKEIKTDSTEIQFYGQIR